MPIPRLKLESTAVLLIDVQARLLPAIHNGPRVVEQVGRLLDGSKLLSLPILVTEQYRKGLGVTVDALQPRIADAACNVEKLHFSACVDGITSELRDRGLRQVIVCGIEAHVCVLQTCLDLIDRGYVTFLALDAIGSRHAEDQAAAVQRMIQAGVVPTTVESALLELVGEAGTSRFKAILPIIK